MLLQEDRLLWVGRWVFLQSVASTLKCFSLQHICPKWSLIAHWRMHDIKCLQTWNNHVLSLLEIVCSGICINHHVEQNRSSHHTSEACPVFVLTMPVVHCVRDSIYFTGTSVNVTVFCFMETLCFPCAVEKRIENRSSARSSVAGELKGFSVAILPSICLLGWISVELQYFLIVGNFCTVLLK